MASDIDSKNSGWPRMPSYDAAAVPNLSYNVTNEKLAFRSQLPPEAGLLVVFSSNDAFLLDNRYQVARATHPEDLMAVLLRVEKKIDQILDSVRRFVPPQLSIV